METIYQSETPFTRLGNVTTQNTAAWTPENDYKDWDGAFVRNVYNYVRNWRHGGGGGGVDGGDCGGGRAPQIHASR